MREESPSTDSAVSTEGKTAVLAADCLEFLFSVPNSERPMGSHKQDGGVVANSGPEEPVDVVMPSRLG
jgi:hypothetical protein